MDKARIVLAEDDQQLGPQLKTLFELEGYSVQVVEDGRLALTHCIEAPPDLIILDVGLPSLTGYQVCQALRKKEVASPILFLTERGAVAEKVLGFNCGADDYLAKPFDPMELIARVEALLRRSKKNRLRSFQFGRIEVNLDTSEVNRFGERVFLTASELRILAALIDADGRILSRQQLIDAANDGPGVSVGDGSINNHIMNIRRKIEENPLKPRYLLSVRKVGYRLVANGNSD